MISPFNICCEPLNYNESSNVKIFQKYNIQTFLKWCNTSYMIIYIHYAFYIMLSMSKNMMANVHLLKTYGDLYLRWVKSNFQCY